jgi:hypothetical protein
MCVLSAARRRSGVTTHAVPPAQRGRPPQPALAESARRAVHVCAAAGASRSRRDVNALCRPHNTTALSSRRWRRARAVRPMCVLQPARRNRGGTSTCCAARATERCDHPPPAGDGGGHAPRGPCVYRRRRVAIAAGRARAVQPPRRDRPPRPALAEGARRAAHVCAASGASRSRRDEHALCHPRDGATRPPSPAGAGGGHAPCGPCVCHRLRIAIAAGRARAVPPARAPCGPCACRRWRVAIAAGRARAVPPARQSDATALPGRRWRWERAARSMCVPPASRRDCCRTSTRCAARATERRDRPPQPALAEGSRRAAHVCAAVGASRARQDEQALCRPPDQATRPPSPAGAGRGRTPCGPCVCRCRRVAIAAGRTRDVSPA